MRWVALALLASATLGAPASAQSYLPKDFAQAAEKVSVREVFRTLKNKYGGAQLGYREVSRGARVEYHIDWLSGDGRKLRIVVDARTGRELSAKGA